MTDWLIILFVLPLAVGAIVLLWGFAGCGIDAVGTGVLRKPTNLTATVINKDQVRLTWHDNSDYTATAIVQRADPGGSFHNAGQTSGSPAGSVSWDDPQHLANGTYSYRVIATPSNETDPQALTSDSVAVTISGSIVPPPPSPTGTQIVHSYTSGTNATEIVPSGFKQVVIECYGPGGNGGENSGGVGGGGGGGAYCKKTIALVAADAGKSMTYIVGATAGTGSTIITSSLANGSATFVVGKSGANGTNLSGGAGGTAIGGDVNTSGNPGSNSPTGTGGNCGGPGGGAGGSAGANGKPPGGGGGGGNVGAAGQGAGGKIIFTYNP